jgi:hypothetical protein
MPGTSRKSSDAAPGLRAIIERLEASHGTPEPPVAREPFAAVIWENGGGGGGAAAAGRRRMAAACAPAAAAAWTGDLQARRAPMRDLPADADLCLVRRRRAGEANRAARVTRGGARRLSATCRECRHGGSGAGRPDACNRGTERRCPRFRRVRSTARTALQLPQAMGNASGGQRLEVIDGGSRAGDGQGTGAQLLQAAGGGLRAGDGRAQAPPGKRDLLPGGGPRGGPATL